MTGKSVKAWALKGADGKISAGWVSATKESLRASVEIQDLSIWKLWGIAQPMEIVEVEIREIKRKRK